MAEPERSLRVGLFTYSTKPRGGVVHTLDLANALAALGCEPVVTALDESRTGFFRPVAVRTQLVPVTPVAGDTTAFVRQRIADYVRALEREIVPCDVYHAHDGISANALATMVERGSIPSFVRTVHHLDAFADRDLAALQDRSVTSAAALFVVSERWRRALRGRFGREATVVRNGVDPARFRLPSDEERAARRRDCGFGPEPVFLAIGGIERRKNTLGMLEAFARVRSAVPAARLVIAGGASVFDHGAYVAEFDRRAADLGVGDAIVRIGVASDERIAALLQAADAVVFPSLEEGFGLVTLEGLACGTPVVTSAIEPFTDYLDERCALLVDPSDPAAIAAAMQRTLDPAVRATLRAAGVQHAKRFSWHDVARAHLTTYKEQSRARNAVSHSLAG